MSINPDLIDALEAKIDIAVTQVWLSVVQAHEDLGLHKVQAYRQAQKVTNEVAKGILNKLISEGNEVGDSVYSRSEISDWMKAHYGAKPATLTIRESTRFFVEAGAIWASDGCGRTVIGLVSPPVIIPSNNLAGHENDE